MPLDTIFTTYPTATLVGLRTKWIDATLYQNLEELWSAYVRVEGAQRHIIQQELIKQIQETKPNFLEVERDAHRIPKSPR